MWKLFIGVVVLALLACSCSTIKMRPVDVEMPSEDRHFIVREPSVPQTHQPETPPET
jgi:hypothetical protein